MQHAILPILLIAGVLSAVDALPARADGEVRLELVGEGRGSPLVFQQWSQALGRAGVRNVRIRSTGGTARVGIETQEFAGRPIHVVTGVIRSADELILPSGRYRRSDVGRLKQWLDDLAERGPESRREPLGPFGFTAEQFDALRQVLALPLTTSTADADRADVVQRIGRQLPMPLQVDADAVAQLRGDKVTEELSGLACGTALAYALRPAGYGLVPRPQGRGAALAVVRMRQGLDIWPVGWEPERPTRDSLPGLYEFHNVNIQGVAAERVVNVIAEKLDVPVLVDHNALARHGLDMQKPVSHPSSRTTYGMALRKMLFQAGLKYDIRADEADKPFFWITSVKPM